MTAKVLHAAFNGQQDALVVSSEQGVRVFNTDPAVLLHSIDADVVGSVKVSSMVARANLVALVGSGSASKFPQNICFVYDIKHNELVLEITLQGGPILNVLLGLSRLVVVQDKRVQVFSIPEPCVSMRIEETRLNVNGLAAMSGEMTTTDNQILVYPGFKLGSIQILNVKNLSSTSSLAPNSIDAHQSEIAVMTVNFEGTIIATGSSMGTVIRIWNSRSRLMLQECRRGTDPSTLHVLQFSPCSSFLAVSSDKGTIHIFSLQDYDRATKKSFLQQVAKTIGKNERRSCAQIGLEPQVLACGFVKAPDVRDHALVTICADGTYHKFTFDLDGHINRVMFDYIMLLADEQEFWSKPL